MDRVIMKATEALSWYRRRREELSRNRQAYLTR